MNMKVNLWLNNSGEYSDEWITLQAPPALVFGVNEGPNDSGELFGEYSGEFNSFKYSPLIRIG
ncbi:hypothetical protein [Enterobacter hormaechei]|uniref:hypothetical protein n=1 Tax=Enterobacter hormaechei TaxID=158836 RepID=UPI002E17AD81|nr:hypothetical protein [Enterobacter hormaechei]